MSRNISVEIRKYRDEILEDVVRAVEIESAAGEPLPGMPFGEGPAKALNFCLGLAQSFGLKVKNLDNYAGYVEYGEGEGEVAVLAHVDVVPAGEGWTFPPFGGKTDSGRIYGRGTMDDKSQAIAAIYCLKTLRDLNIRPSRRIRVILGASEEKGMEDMEYYFAHEPLPDLAFTPDGEYPICNCEKGILQMTFRGNTPEGSNLISFEAGTASNMVPVTAKAVLECGSDVLERLKEKAKPMEEKGARFDFSEREGTLAITCTGRAAHASTPELGLNAASFLLRLIGDEFGTGLLKMLDEKVGLENDGSSAGVAAKDTSGALTLNLGIVKADAHGVEAVIDIRYPISSSGEALEEKFRAIAQACSAELIDVHDKAPLYVPEDSFLIQKLKKAYETVMHQKATVYSTGGGSYARALENRGVAFGAGIRPLSYYRIHAADEFLDIEDFMKHCEICLQAIYELSVD